MTQLGIQPKTSWSGAVALSAEPVGQVLGLLNGCAKHPANEDGHGIKPNWTEYAERQ